MMIRTGVTFFLALVTVSAVPVSASFVCPNGVYQELESCNLTVECPVYRDVSHIGVLSTSPPVATSCRVVLRSTTGIMIATPHAANMSSSAACLPWIAFGQPASASADTLRSTCETARYRSYQFYFAGDVVLTFSGRSISEDMVLIYSAINFHQLCTTVVSLNNTSYVAAPLDFAGGNCTSRLVSPPGTVMRLSVADSGLRVGSGGLLGDCICYGSENETATGGCLAAGSLVDVGNGITITVKGDSTGLLCSAVILVTVSAKGPPISAVQASEASKPFLCQVLLLSAAVQRFVRT